MENNLAVPQKVKYREAIWSSNSTPSYLSNRNENVFLTKIFTQIFIVVLFIIAKRGQLKCLLTSEWIKKIWNSHSMKYYLAAKIYFFLKIVLWRTLSEEWKEKSQTTGNICNIAWLKDLYLKYTDYLELHKKETIPFKDGQRIWTLYQEKTYRWQISIWKDAPYHV